MAGVALRAGTDIGRAGGRTAHEEGRTSSASPASAHRFCASSVCWLEAVCWLGRGRGGRWKRDSGGSVCILASDGCSLCRCCRSLHASATTAAKAATAVIFHPGRAKHDWRRLSAPDRGAPFRGHRLESASVTTAPFSCANVREQKAFLVLIKAALMLSHVPLTSQA